jgi:AcrR family transcriptional regulator
MGTKRSSHETRNLIINAANRVVLERSINQMTLEGVAQVAGVSKGGLLYHFASKDALIEGMVEAYLRDFERRIDMYMADEDTPKTWVKAYILASIDSPPEEIALSAALLAAFSVNPDLLRPMRERYGVWQEKMSQIEDGTLIRLALDGLWFSDLVGLAPPDHKQRQRVLTRLLQMINEQRTTSD